MSNGSTAKTKRLRRPPVRGFYIGAVSEAEKPALASALHMEGLEEEIAVLRVKLRSAIKEHPEDLPLLTQGVGMLVRAVAAQYRLSPKARKDLGDRIALVLNSLGDQLLPADR